MFDDVARRYDLTNDVLSLGQDRRWRRVVVDAVDPRPGETVLDLAAGTGTSAEPMADAGVQVVACDLSVGMLDVGKRRRPDLAFVAGDALHLPFADASFDAVVACLVFEHIDAVDEAVAEIARVLEPGGRFCFFLNHPLLQTPGSGWIDDQIVEPPEQYWRIGPYLTEDLTVEEVEKDVFIPFIHRPLSCYVNALAGNGLLIERMEEPSPPPGFLARAEEYEAAATIPRLLLLVTRKTSPKA